MAKFLRYSRITWTVLCGVACVLLICLWVRSYGQLDSLNVRLSATRLFTVTSLDGTLWAAVLPGFSSPVPNDWWLGHHSVPKQFSFPPNFWRMPLWLVATGVAA